MDGFGQILSTMCISHFCVAALTPQYGSVGNKVGGLGVVVLKLMRMFIIIHTILQY